MAGRINARRSFAGPEGFRKERTLPTFEDGFNAGLEPLTWNPIEMQMLRLREVVKSITAHSNFEEMKAKGAFKYFGLGQRLPQGWAFTGKGPDDPKDLIFPKTGRMNQDGTAERLSFPTYLAHDVAPLFNRSDEGPFRWAQNALGMIPGKLNPILSVPWETFAKNEDYRGAMIRNPNDPILQQTKDVFAHVLKALSPFSVESMLRSRGSGASAGQTAAGFFGVQPAGYRQTHSAEQQRQAESGRKVELTPLQKKLRGP